VKKRRITSAASTGCRIAEVECKSALVRSKIEGTDYALNPYIGCQHGCVYCYAEFMKKYTNHSEEWGTFVDAKINIADRLGEQVKRTKPGVVQLSTVTDAYQPVEKEFCLTRRCLEILADFDFPISIQTKSDLVLRDMDILKRIKDKDIGFTITCADPKMEKIFEPGAASLDRRLEALKKLQENDIPTFVFVGPILPYFSDSIEALRSLFGKLKEIGIDRIYVDRMNYLKGKRKRIASVLKNQFPDALRLYEGAIKHEEEYAEWLKGNLASALSGFSFDSEVLF
jgi:DNA repair photolyase